MNISQFIALILSGQVLAAIVASITTFVINRINTQQGRKKAAQDWATDLYITKGLDPLIAYILNLSLYLLDTTIGKKMPLSGVPRGFAKIFGALPSPLPPNNILPTEALTNLQTLFGNTLSLDIIAMIHASLNLVPEAGEYLLKLSYILLRDRSELLEKISKGVGTKGAQIDTEDLQDRIIREFVQPIYEKTKNKTHWVCYTSKTVPKTR